MTNLGEVLSCYRAMHRLTVRKLGHVIGVSGSTISRIENGLDPDVHTFQKILNWLLKASK